MRRPSRYKLLRSVMADQDISTYDLGELFKKSSRCINDKLSGAVPWTLPEIYRVLDFLELPHDQLHRYFPPNGISEKIEEKPKEQPLDIRVLRCVETLTQVAQKMKMEVAQ